MMSRLLSPFVAILAMAACQHNQAAAPAVLVDDSEATLEALKTSLASAMERAQIELGAGDPTSTPSVAVLPPPPTTFETTSTAMPTVFNLYIRDGECFAVREGMEIEIPLPDLACRPA